MITQVFAATFRSLRRKPAFALAVVATLALGIAPNCIVFAIMDAIYFRPLPYPAQDRLALVGVVHKDMIEPGEVDGQSFREWRARSRGFEGLALYRGAGFDVTIGNRPERVTGQRVTSDFFRVVGAAPAVGRAFGEADFAPGAPPVLVISHRAWLDLFDGRGDIVNLPVRINGTPGTVIGVMPAAFTSFMEGRTARAWAPLAVEAGTTAPEQAAGRAIGRLRWGVTLEQAQAELKALDRAVPHDDAQQERSVAVRDFKSALFAGLGPGIRMLAVIVGLLLLIACANAANLLLGRAAERSREVALHAALGASRWRLAAGLLSESLLLAALGSAVGLLLAFWGLRVVWAGSAPIFLRIGVDRFAFDGRVIVFAVCLAALTAVLFGAGPALSGSRADLAAALKSGAAASGSRTGRMGRALVVGQAALCVVTLLVAALMVRSFLHFSGLASNPGFDPQRLLVATLPLPADPAPAARSRQATVQEIERRLSATPGIESVTLTSSLPFLESGRPVAVSSRRPGAGQAAEQKVEAEARAVNAAYFDAFSVRVVKGRAIDARDAADAAPVVVVDQRLADAAWGTGDPIGSQVVVDGSPRTVVGVVASSAQPTPFQRTLPAVLVPYAQSSAGDVKVVAKSRLSATVVAGAIRRAAAGVDRDQPLVDLQPVARALDDFMTPFRLILALISLFGWAALALAALGLYGVMSRAVSRRSREIGVRVAVGASRRNVVSMVMREGLRTALIGLSVGLVLGLAVTAILPSQLLGVRGLAAWHYPAAVLTWLAAAAIACAIPARRAAALDPLAALRSE